MASISGVISSLGWRLSSKHCVRWRRATGDSLPALRHRRPMRAVIRTRGWRFSMRAQGRRGILRPGTRSSVVGCLPAGAGHGASGRAMAHATHGAITVRENQLDIYHITLFFRCIFTRLAVDGWSLAPPPRVRNSALQGPPWITGASLWRLRAQLNGRSDVQLGPSAASPPPAPSVLAAAADRISACPNLKSAYMAMHTHNKIALPLCAGDAILGVNYKR